MAKSRLRPWTINAPMVEKGIVIDSFRGQTRLRIWPRKRGKPTSQAIAEQNSWFAKCRKTAKLVDPTQLDQAIIMATGTGLYPNDILMSAMMSGFYQISTEDGRMLKPLSYTIEQVTMQGARIERTTTQAVTGSVDTPISFNSPIINDATMWNVSAPTRITIPNNVNRVELEGFAAFSHGAGSSYYLAIRKNGTTFICYQFTTGAANAAANVATGPLPVVAGDYFELVINTVGASTVVVSTKPYIAAKILQTT